MGLLGNAITAGGIICILLPIVAGISRLVSGPDLAVAIDYAPTFVLGGIFFFVLGTGIRIYTDR